MNKILDFFRGHSKKQLKQLHVWNLVLATIYAVQGVIVLIFGDSATKAVTAGYLARDPLLSGDGSLTLTTAWVHISEVRIIYLVAAMMFTAAAFHILAATVWRKRYEADMGKGINTLGWAMYAITLSFIMVVIGLMSGVSDLVSLLLLVLVIMFVSTFGAMADKWRKGSKLPSWIGVACMVKAVAVPWVVIAIYVWIASINGGYMPGSTYLMQLSLFVITALIAANAYLQYKKQGKWAEFLFGERLFLILLFLAQTALAWQVIAAS